MEQSHHSRFMLIILAGVLLFASIAGFFISQNFQVKNKTGETVEVTPTAAPTLIPYPKNGLYYLKLKGSENDLKVGSPFTVELYATSKDTVAGYDVVMSYDMQALSRQSVQNMLSLFRIFTYDRGNHVSISATKNISVAEPVSFTETPILSFTFIPKAKGSYVFSLKAVGNESSKLVNESAAVTYPETTDMRLEIRL